MSDKFNGLSLGDTVKFPSNLEVVLTVNMTYELEDDDDEMVYNFVDLIYKNSEFEF